MMEWLFGKGIAYVLGWLAFAFIYPAYKSGFYVRQGLAYRNDITKLDALLLETGKNPNDLPPEVRNAYNEEKKKALLMLTLAPIALLVMTLICTGLFGSWTFLWLFPLTALLGFINIKD